jgi:hypothetical protein
VSSIRTRLSDRRESTTFAFECRQCRCLATVSHFPNGELAEIFLSAGKIGSDLDLAAKDSAVVVSIALQYDVPLDVIRKALLQDAQGGASGPLGTALDRVAESAHPDSNPAAVDPEPAIHPASNERERGHV